MNIPSISFLICTLNREHLFERAIRSLIQNKILDVSFEVIVVDQGSSNEVKQICRDTNSIYIKSLTKGLSVARNIGAKYCNGEWIAFLDDDAYVSESYFQNFNILLTSNEINNLSAFSGRIMTIEDKSKPYNRYQTSLSKTISYINMDTILSSALVVRKKSLDSVGWFDEKFGIGAKWGGSEEGDLTVRLINNNYKIQYFPLLIVHHPELNFSAMTYKQVFDKSYNYGLGRGAMLRKNTFLPTILTIRAFITPIIGVFGSLILLNPKNASRFFFSFIGRINGFTGYNN